MTDTQELWSPNELAAFLKLPEETLRDWRYKSTGPPWFKLGKHVRYDPGVVHEWLAAQTIKPDAV